ncbi:MAG: anthranilate synthase component I [Candidatus Dadabacteria bacterium]|nr:anthranilate synthase component I [Candidatus Dadabacteria bacterium]NIQ17060.1 anthranilate synthase component I [Candidatus Dadabacteria bacterium]
MAIPTFKEFKDKLRYGNLIPVWEEILADFDTPVSAFKKIDSSDYSFLLESVEGGEKWAQFSFLGTNPSIIFRSKGNEIEIIENGSVKKIKGDPIDSLRDILSIYKPVLDDELPRFHGGAVGYFSYDIVRFVEKLPEIGPDELGLWDSLYMITDSVLVFDNINHKIKIVANAYVGDSDDPKAAYDIAVTKIEELKNKLKKPLGSDLINNLSLNSDGSECKLESNFEPEKFKEAVLKTKEYIKAGDIIQAVISQRWKTDLDVNTFDLYRALRVLNPSPYMFYLKMKDLVLVGSSPEVMVRVEGNKVENRPIAGTRPRGKNPTEDSELEKELLADPKERAEHIMLVDLARNDLGRIAKVGTVKVDELMTIEKYSHVMHIVSNVIAELRSDKDAFDVIKATFPAGTLSGAPKIRAMEIIEEMEPSRRGAYGGAIGYFGYSGNMDSCITIRTFVIKDNKIYIQAGAGIVADSNPDTEYEETVNKVKALVKAVELVQSP